MEQTQTEVQKWLQNLRNKSGELGIEGQLLEDLKWLAKNSPVILMGGEDPGEWDIYPEKPAILIGTQDMLLSRALNRGYGMSRYRWPMHFGLLNNDCLWVIDETQLMGVGVETSAQLDGFRSSWQTHGCCPTWWMSATLDEARLATVDHQQPVGGWLTEKLSNVEQRSGRPYELITAPKKLSPSSLVLNATSKNGYAKQLAELIAQRHRTLLEKPHPLGTLTLAVVNRVSRAREIYQALTTGNNPPTKVALIHSRFRPVDRKQHTKLLFGASDRIVIATQAVEAGVDVSARLLITELAPWSSLVQRMGRCNRRADIADAEVLWVDIELDTKGELLLPYKADELKKARAALKPLTDASSQALHDAKVEPEEKIIRPVIRRRDLVDLFDTTADLCGQDLDISRYIRDADDNDVQFFWRDIKGDTPKENEVPPQRDELCRVSIGDAAKFLGKKAWPGAGIRSKSNGNSPCTLAPAASILWMSERVATTTHSAGLDPKDKPTLHPPKDGWPETYAGNRLSFLRTWQTIAEHTALVVKETDLLAALLAKDFEPTLHAAALWHDIGKAHKEFQKALRDGKCQPPIADGLYAKSENPPTRFSTDKSYRSIRHELASALAWLLADTTRARQTRFA